MSDEGNGAVIITYADAPQSLTETVASRASDSITLSWTSGAANGGSAVTGYRVSSDGATGTWAVIATGVAATSYTATGLTAGLSYKFKVEAENGFGFSAFSSSVSILCATVPSQPTPPSTTVVNSDVIFDWEKPNENGTPITEYKVYIRKADLTYVFDNSLCDGRSQAVIDSTQCTVPLSSLTSAPFLLQKGYSVHIKVIAVNAYGDSISSVTGNGALI